jgi:hypothetical protein
MLKGNNRENLKAAREKQTMTSGWVLTRAKPDFFFFSSSSSFFFFIVVLGVHYGIYKSSYNVSSISTVEFTPSIILLYPHLLPFLE